MIGRQLQQYLIVEKAGEGGMGVVWRARAIRLDRDVALKVLPERFTDDLGRERFAREAKSASALNHPNIVTSYEIDSDAGLDFIAMEFIRGETLAQRIAKVALGIQEVIDYATHIADALACAHEAGLDRLLEPMQRPIAIPRKLVDHRHVELYLRRQRWLALDALDRVERGGRLIRFHQVRREPASQLDRRGLPRHLVAEQRDGALVRTDRVRASARRPPVRIGKVPQ